MQTFDAIVLGMGAMGAAATYQLAKRGVRVLGIDQYDPPHQQGSTHGETRITRIACGEGENYAPFARRSHEIWREAERELGIGPGALLTQNGMILIAGPKEQRGHGISAFLNRTFNIAANVGVPAERLSASDIRSRFPAFAVADDECAYLDQVSGFVRPEACVMAQLWLARRYGATTHTNEKVLQFEPSGGGVRVTTDKGEYRAGRLIVTAGSWLPELVPDAAHHFKVQRQVLYWFAAKDEAQHACFAPARFPVFIWLIPATQPIYGFPALGNLQDGIKIATEQELTTTDPKSVDWNVSTTEREEMYETYVRPFFPGLSGNCVRAEVCLYTNVDKGRFIIDRHPSMDKVTVASPCSGHGFKHSAAIGETLAQMVTGEQHLDISPFAFNPMA